MSTTLENSAEVVIAAILGANTDLVGFSIVQEDTDAQAAKDRIVLNASPREVELPGKEPGAVVAWRIMVQVTVFFVTRAESSYDAIIAAVEASLNAASPPAAAQSLWVSSFPSGATLEQTSDGTMDTAQNTRSRMRTFRFIVIA
jgi:hypothetical protein